jgi:hypothetical protein
MLIAVVMRLINTSFLLHLVEGHEFVGQELRNGNSTVLFAEGRRCA